MEPGVLNHWAWVGPLLAILGEGIRSLLNHARAQGCRVTCHCGGDAPCLDINCRPPPPLQEEERYVELTPEFHSTPASPLERVQPASFRRVRSRSLGPSPVPRNRFGRLSE